MDPRIFWEELYHSLYTWSNSFCKPHPETQQKQASKTISIREWNGNTSTTKPHHNRVSAPLPSPLPAARAQLALRVARAPRAQPAPLAPLALRAAPAVAAAVGSVPRKGVHPARPLAAAVAAVAVAAACIHLAMVDAW